MPLINLYIHIFSKIVTLCKQHRSSFISADLFILVASTIIYHILDARCRYVFCVGKIFLYTPIKAKTHQIFYLFMQDITSFPLTHKSFHISYQCHHLLIIKKYIHISSLLCAISMQVIWFVLSQTSLSLTIDF